MCYGILNNFKHFELNIFRFKIILFPDHYFVSLQVLEGLHVLLSPANEVAER